MSAVAIGLAKRKKLSTVRKMMVLSFFENFLYQPYLIAKKEEDAVRHLLPLYYF